MFKALSDWWFKLQWNRRLKQDKRAGRWPL
jgi:hypothetical protein